MYLSFVFQSTKFEALFPLRLGCIGCTKVNIFRAISGYGETRNYEVWKVT